MRIYIVIDLEDEGKVQYIYQNKDNAITYCKDIRNGSWEEGNDNLIIEEHTLQDAA